MASTAPSATLPVNVPKRRGPAHPAVASLLMTAVALASSMLLGEFYLRLFKPQPIIPRYVEAGPHGIRQNLPDVRGEVVTPEYRHPLTTNSVGLRGSREYSLEKPAGVYRVVVLGDSVALGHGVSDGETFAARVERALGEKRPVEVLNFGVSGFGNAEQLIQLTQVGLRYAPDLVVLTYFPNDPYNNVVSRLYRLEGATLVREQGAFVPALGIRDRLYRIPGYAFLSQHSHLVNLLRNRASSFFQQKLAREVGVAAEAQTEVPPHARALTAALIRELSRTTQKSGADFLVLDVPVIRAGAAIQNLPKELTAEGVEVVDVLAESYRGRRLDEVSYAEDCHPTPLGHALIAQTLSSHIEERLWRTAR